jgi:hypothetical protein
MQLATDARATRRNILQYTIFRSHRRENLKTYLGRLITSVSRTKNKFFILIDVLSKLNVAFWNCRSHFPKLVEEFTMSVCLEALECKKEKRMIV